MPNIRISRIYACCAMFAIVPNVWDYSVEHLHRISLWYRMRTRQNEPGQREERAQTTMVFEHWICDFLCEFIAHHSKYASSPISFQIPSDEIALTIGLSTPKGYSFLGARLGVCHRTSCVIVFFFFVFHCSKSWVDDSLYYPHNSHRSRLWWS